MNRWITRKIVATLTSSAIFFALLVLVLVANEFLRDRLSSLRLLVRLYALVCFAFFTFFLPVMTGLMNAVIFLIGAGLCVDRAAGRVLFPQLGSSHAALDEVRRDLP